jgi:hypothetical protein
MTDTRESTQIWFATALSGPLLNDEEMVRTFAALILKRLCGEAELAKQQPLRVTDQGAAWVVIGSYQEPNMLPDTGAWFIRVRKSDCRVEKFGHYEPREVSDEVKSILVNAKGAT